MSDEPLIEVTLPAPADEVWAHLRDPERLARWFGWEYEGLEGEIAFIFHGPPEGVELPEGYELPPDAGVRADDDGRVLELDYGGGTVDRFVVTAEGDGARLRLTRTVAPDAWDGVFDDIGEGWITFVQQLRFLLERHPGQDRRTAFLASPVTATTDLLAALGVERVDGPWAGMLGPDAGRSGDLWFRTDHQVGVTVDQWGPGLFAVIDSPRGVASAVLTTYGLDDDAVAELSERWTAWWSEHVGASDPDGPHH